MCGNRHQCELRNQGLWPPATTQPKTNHFLPSAPSPTQPQGHLPIKFSGSKGLSLGPACQLTLHGRGLSFSVSSPKRVVEQSHRGICLRTNVNNSRVSLSTPSLPGLCSPLEPGTTQIPLHLWEIWVVESVAHSHRAGGGTSSQMSQWAMNITRIPATCCHILRFPPPMKTPDPSFHLPRGIHSTSLTPRNSKRADGLRSQGLPHCKRQRVLGAKCSGYSCPRTRPLSTTGTNTAASGTPWLSITLPEARVAWPPSCTLWAQYGVLKRL